MTEEPTKSPDTPASNPDINEDARKALKQEIEDNIKKQNPAGQVAPSTVETAAETEAEAAALTAIDDALENVPADTPKPASDTDTEEDEGDWQTKLISSLSESFTKGLAELKRLLNEFLITWGWKDREEDSDEDAEEDENPNENDANIAKEYPLGNLETLPNKVFSVPKGSAQRGSPFGVRPDPLKPGEMNDHEGEDVSMKIGTPLVATGPSKVSRISHSEKGGTTIVLEAPDGSRMTFLHLNKIFVKEDQTLSPGQVFAHSGKTGKVTGPHLHLEYRNPSGTKENPGFLLEGLPYNAKRLAQMGKDKHDHDHPA